MKVLAAFKALLTHYPKAELAPSAQWMIDHMRSEEAPAFINMTPDAEADAAIPGPATGTKPAPKKSQAVKP